MEMLLKMDDIKHLQATRDALSCRSDPRLLKGLLLCA